MTYTAPSRTKQRGRNRRRDWVRTIARGLCAALALLGLAPFVTVLVVRSAWARGWVTRETERALSDRGIVAAYESSLRAWPVAVELTRVRIESSDGGPPALACSRIRVRPKLLALMAGKIAIDQVELEQPVVRLVVRDGLVTSLRLPEREPSRGGELHVPFNTFSVTDGSLDLDVDGVKGQASSVDLDVSAEDDPSAGSSLEIALRVGRASVHRERRREDGSLATDDDALCSIDGRIGVEPGVLLVRRLHAVGAADLDALPGTTPECDLPLEDKRRVELSLGHVHARLSQGEGKWPEIDGHLGVRAPIALAQRAASLPETDGWIRFDADVRYGRDTILPEVSGTLEAHDLRLDRYALAEELHSELTIRRNVVESPKTTLRLGGGSVTLTNTVVAPLAGGGRLEKTTLDASGVDFTALLRDLGIHPHAHVAWDIRELHAPLISGTFQPLKLDGEFTGKTYGFGVYDRPAEDHSRGQIFGFSEAQIAAHLGVRPDAIKFTDVHAVLPRSRIDGGTVSLGFDDDLRVDAPNVSADLDDLSPIGSVRLHGRLQASARIGGTFSRPEPEADIQSITGFAVSDVAFGDVSAGHVTVDVPTKEVGITSVRAKRRTSLYEVPTARLRFGGERGFVVDGVGTSDGFGIRDLLSMFGLDEDPRFDQLDATLSTRAAVHVALGGPEDACGAGYIAIDAQAHLTDVQAYGERFAQGDADVLLHWYDRQRGIAGADIDVRSFVLDKIQPPVGKRAGSAGTVLGSASLLRGGALIANVMVEGVPLSRVDALGAFARQVEGTVSGVAHVNGSLDDFLPGPGFVARTELDVAGLRVRGVPLAGSHLDVRMTHRLTQEKHIVGRTACGAPVGPPFDKGAYLADTSSRGEWRIDGDLLGGEARLRDVVVTRAKWPKLSGQVSLRGLDLGALAHVFAGQSGDDAPFAAAPLGGQLWGELVADEIPIEHPSESRVKFLLGPTVLSRGGQKLTLQPPREPLTLAGDTLSMPPLQVTLDTADGFRGGFVVTGNVTKATTDPTLALDARLEPVDLAVLQRIVPKVDHASGTVSGSVHLRGKSTSPTIAGELHATGDAIDVHGLPGAITDLHLDAQTTPTQLSFAGSGKFAGGTVVVHGATPLRGLILGTLESHVVARDIRLAPADGIAATVNADLDVAYDLKGGIGGSASLPRVTGDVVIGSLNYSRPIALTTDLTQLGTRAKRTEVDAYDPSLDFVSLDLRLRSRAPMVIKNNLVEVLLAIDSGTLEVTGTNQRLGLRGTLRALPGGRIHFQQNDFEVRQGLIRFDDPTRLAPVVDVTAVTEYRRYTDANSPAGAGVGTGGGTTAASAGSTRGSSLWRITLHAWGDADNLRMDMSSEPTLSQEDIVLLLTVGMTRTELDQLQATSLGESLALNYLGATTGADRAIKQVVPIIDDFRFGSAYSTLTGRTEPQLTIGKRLTNDIRASVTAGLSEDRELRSNIEWRLNNRLSVQGSYDNINDVSSSTLGNLGIDLRWRLEFE